MNDDKSKRGGFKRLLAVVRRKPGETNAQMEARALAKLDSFPLDYPWRVRRK